MVELKVIKKDGSVVDFEKKKIIEACKSAGASNKVAEEVADKVTKELPKIQSSKIRELTLKELEKLDPEASKSWIQYDIREKKQESSFQT
jgi:transcriptional regulator NrdR family protein